MSSERRNTVKEHRERLVKDQTTRHSALRTCLDAIAVHRDPASGPKVKASCLDVIEHRIKMIRRYDMTYGEFVAKELAKGGV